MVEQMREGALTLAADGTILYCNQRFAELVAAAARAHPGSVHDFRGPRPRPIALTLKRVLTGGRIQSTKCELQDAAWNRCYPAQLSSSSLVIDGIGHSRSLSVT